MKPTPEQNTELRTHDPDFAAKVLMPPELEWENPSNGVYVAKVFNYVLTVDENGEDNSHSIKVDGNVIEQGETFRDACLLAEIAFLRHYMKSLI
jgi:hypothetical protein